jgi:hypothetical protein
MHKCLIKYIKINGRTHMIIHVQTTHPKLFVMKKHDTKMRFQFNVHFIRFWVNLDIFYHGEIS